MPEFKGINSERLRVPPAYISAMCVQLRRHTLTASHLVDDDIDICTANIPEDIIANEVDTTRLVYSRTDKRSNTLERLTVGRAAACIQRQVFATARIPISRIVCSSLTPL